MNTRYVVRLHGAKETSSHTVPPHQAANALHLQVPPGAKVELFDAELQAAPDNVRIERHDKALLVFFAGSPADQPDVVLDGYYDDNGAGRLIGHIDGGAAGGAFYEYVPETGQTSDYVSQLGQDLVAGQALGSMPTTGDAYAVGLSPAWLLAGLALVGVGAAAAHHHSSSSSGTGNTDTTPPTGLTAELNPNSDSGVKGDSITSDTTPTISGQVEANSHVTVVSPVGETLTATADANGAWSVTPTHALSDGTGQVFSVTASDAAGNTTAPVTVAVTIDTKAPAAPTLALDPSSDTGTVGDGITADTTPTITGSGAEVGDTITVTLPSGATLTATVDSNGDWSVTPSASQALTDGTNVITATATDAAGNTSAHGSITLTINSGMPAVTGSLVHDAVSDTGFLYTDNLTDNPTPWLTGHVSGAGAVVVVVGGQTLHTTADASGNWTVQVPSALSEGTQTMQITYTDSSGTASTGKGVPFVVDLTPPTVDISLATASDTGTVGDNITTDSTPTFVGHSEAGARIEIAMPSTGEYIVTFADTNGNWTATSSRIIDPGTYVVTVVATDAAGNKNTASLSDLTIQAATGTSSGTTTVSDSSSTTTASSVKTSVLHLSDVLGTADTSHTSWAITHESGTSGATTAHTMLPAHALALDMLHAQTI